MSPGLGLTRARDPHLSTGLGLALAMPDQEDSPRRVKLGVTLLEKSAQDGKKGGEGVGGLGEGASLGCVVRGVAKVTFTESAGGRSSPCSSHGLDSVLRPSLNSFISPLCPQRKFTPSASSGVQAKFTLKPKPGRI